MSDTILKHQIHAQNGDRSGYPDIMEGFLSSGGALLSPHQTTLKRGSEYAFSIHVPNALKVAVIDGKKWHWLQVDGDHFSAQVRADSSEVVIAAAFPANKKRFEYLVRYTVR
ncbi:MAG: hypothetical protein CO186_01535 [Zetaproteobacteria bacterium CG_4_9_14_3_um_filter_49_83]|nr:MAG: hypothetical protein AUJ56_05005 [Zetaproteobacteria bacterium CG1_02_49_23]PIV29845.1 MAG: hypothetical protein COS35_09900 [Zetaproteobacteria bacterium CG02_land_8_20_14_3_00_50_9]PIY56684.1 MAG: hypothetical protein COZ00_02795 [Zetaproteobacteria bacterium CG_4_10_14_0_8_um_filter_49_80]PJA36246.1 MAG: hypothetical protein CO186_01535 [Zetaproteobacteria bacterium CG_4_9_14_3_um_filter_49_83]